MISRSLYIAGTGDPIANLANGLAVSEERCFAETDCPDDYSFFAAEESSLFYSRVDGAFQFAVDIHLFAIDWPGLESVLLALSTKGLLMAVPDESSSSPLDFILYEAGKKHQRAIIEDESANRLQIFARD